MNILKETEIEYPCTVTVRRPGTSVDEEGNYQESYTTIIENMTADIQLSLNIRNLMNEDGTGSTENTEWIMYCNPPAPISEGDEVFDSARTFVVVAVGEWGSHTECMMRRV